MKDRRLVVRACKSYPSLKDPFRVELVGRPEARNKQYTMVFFKRTHLTISGRTVIVELKSNV